VAGIVTRSAGPDAPAHRRSGPLAVRRRRRLLGLVLLLLALAAAGLASVAIGARPVGLSGVWHALVAPTGTADDLTIRALRLPRTALGLAAGAALGVAGALMQGHTRNPLADPGLLGVTAGAAFAVVLAVSAFGVASLSGYVWFGFAGALLASVGVFLLGSSARGGATPVTLALAGAAVTALLHALTTAVVLLDARSLDAYRFWQIGSLIGRDPGVVGRVAPFLAVGLVLAAANAPGLNALALGEDVARALGQRIGLIRLLGVLAVTVLTGASVAACGPLAFVGLVVPHAARAVCGADYRWVLPYSALFGAVLLLAADVLGRVVARPGELEVGIMLALVGAPFLVVLVRRRRLARL
jgi:iron complex transport system permease protein